MANRDLSLVERVEDVRDKQQPVVSVVSFTLAQIKSHFDAGMSAIDNQLLVADGLLADGKVDACKDIWRAQVVFAESTLDFYLHEVSKYGMLKIFQGSWNKTERYNKFMVPMSVLEEGMKTPESITWFTTFLNQRFSREVYLSFESMKDQMNLLGLNFGPLLDGAFPKPGDPNTPHRTGKKIISELFDRRNQIAHQGDRAHANAERNDITKEYVDQCLAEIKTLVAAIQSAVEKKDATE